jgi:hypothetical protein
MELARPGQDLLGAIQVTRDEAFVSYLREQSSIEGIGFGQCI